MSSQNCTAGGPALSATSTIIRKGREDRSRGGNALGSDLPDDVFHAGTRVQSIAEVNREPDEGTHPAKEDPLVGFAESRRKALVQTDLQEAAIDMKGVEPVLNTEESFYQGLSLQERSASRDAVVIPGVHLPLASCSCVEMSVRKDARTPEKPSAF
jgi:hypothetical protein